MDASSFILGPDFFHIIFLSSSCSPISKSPAAHWMEVTTQRLHQNQLRWYQICGRLRSWQGSFIKDGTRFLEHASILVAEATSMRDGISAALQAGFVGCK